MTFESKFKIKYTNNLSYSSNTHCSFIFMGFFVYLKQCLLVLCVFNEVENCQFDLGFKDQGHPSAARNANCSLVFWLMVFIFGTMIGYGVYITQYNI